MSRTPVILLLSALLSGCVPALDPGSVREPDARTPATYGDLGSTEATGVPLRDELFTDPNLRSLIGDALANNQELLILGQEVRISNAEIIAKRGEYLPRLELRAGAGVDRVGRYTSTGASDHDDEIEPGVETPEALGDFHVALDASWELDIWGKLRKQTRAARLRYLSSVEGRSFVITSLVSEVAESYYELLALDRELSVVETNITLLSDSLDVVQVQKDAGRETSLAVQRFEAELLSNQAHRYDILQRITETENRLNFLCGRYPQPIERSSDGFDTLVPPTLVAGVPAELLEHRPDVRQAELELEAARLDVGAARAAFYPSLSFDASIGDEAYRLAKMGTLPESLLYEVFGSLTAPLLNRSELKTRYLTANAAQMQAVLDYERTLLRAYIEVVNEATRIGNLDEATDRRARQVALLEQAIGTSTDLFQSARADYLEVLTTRRDALEAQLELIETKRSQLTARVALYRALGGGWEAPDASQP